MTERHPYDQLIEDMKQKNIVFEKGLTEEELQYIGKLGGFTFPPDLADFLMRGVPIGKQRTLYGKTQLDTSGFYNWHDSPRDLLEGTQKFLLWGINIDVKHNGFWMSDWGQRPSRLSDRYAIVRRHVEAAPKMIPLYVHRFLPATPCLAGNPVFSIHQTDIVHYGHNLEVYLRNEFINPFDHDDGTEEDFRDIEFWSDLYPS